MFRAPSVRTPHYAKAGPITPTPVPPHLMTSVAIDIFYMPPVSWRGGEYDEMGQGEGGMLPLPPPLVCTPPPEGFLALRWGQASTVTPHLSFCPALPGSARHCPAVGGGGGSRVGEKKSFTKDERKTCE